MSSNLTFSNFFSRSFYKFVFVSSRCVAYPLSAENRNFRHDTLPFRHTNALVHSGSPKTTAMSPDCVRNNAGVITVYIFVLSKEGWGNKCLRSNVTAYIDDLDGRNELLFSSSFFTNV